MIVLTKADLILLHDTQILHFGGLAGVKSEALLESSVNAPFAGFSGLEKYPTLEEKAAALAYSVIKNHAFNDANKRTGISAMLVFLEINGVEMTHPKTSLENLAVDVASNAKGYLELLDFIHSYKS